MTVVVNNLQETIPVDENLLFLVKKAAESVLAAEGVDERVELSVVLVDDNHIHDLNRRFRGRDRPTDVLAFPMREEVPEDGGEPGMLLLGDVVVSMPTAVRQATEYGHDLDREVVRLVIHGTLHLLDYDHENDAGASRMREREDAVIRYLLNSADTVTGDNASAQQTICK
jgi:probable rRNA maturation factor